MPPNCIFSFSFQGGEIRIDCITAYNLPQKFDFTWYPFDSQMHILPITLGNFHQDYIYGESLNSADYGQIGTTQFKDPLQKGF